MAARMIRSASLSATVTGVPSGLISISVSSRAWAADRTPRARSAKDSAKSVNSRWLASFSMPKG